jgi:hypothetical protein
VRRFVITADHGFLLLAETDPKVQSRGRKIDPRRRHVVSTLAEDRDGEARVALADLGYDGTDGYLIFPESTALFDTGEVLTSFAHGGNSLQERVIPVLTLAHRAAAGSSSESFTISARSLEDVGGMHCLEATVERAAQTTLEFGGCREVELSLRAADRDDVQVELCQTRRGARLAGGSVMASVGETFELFFRLSGAAGSRVQVELLHATGDVVVTPARIGQRFAVAAGRSSPAAPSPAPAITGAGKIAGKVGGSEETAEDTGERAWLLDFPSPELRRFFEHLAAHGVVTEAEATVMLGGPRALRRFALTFEELAAKAPFVVRIEAVAGVKRYVREGNGR